jgi:hypothetical protein
MTAGRPTATQGADWFPISRPPRLRCADHVIDGSLRHPASGSATAALRPTGALCGLSVTSRNASLTSGCIERLRLERRRKAYHEALSAQCPHGRERTIGQSDGAWWAGLSCKTGACGIKYIPAEQIYTTWKDG